MSPRLGSVPGLLFAVGSAASFPLAGIFASALMDAGWTAGSTATVRIVFSALVLIAPTAVMLRNSWHLVRKAWRAVLLFSLLAVAGPQLALFYAVRFIPPSLAVLIAFMGPVMLMLWGWARTRVRPGTITLLGAALAVAGLVTVSGVGGDGGLHPLGLLFALIAAVGTAAYYATGAKTDHGIPSLPFVGLGLAAASVALITASATGLLPFALSGEAGVLAGRRFSPWLIAAAMVLISTVLAYLMGVTASRSLGATVASFTGYLEPLFGILWTIVLLAILPTIMQWFGAALIIAGVMTVRIGELRLFSRRPL